MFRSLLRCLPPLFVRSLADSNRTFCRSLSDVHTSLLRYISSSSPCLRCIAFSRISSFAVHRILSCFIAFFCRSLLDSNRSLLTCLSFLRARHAVHLCVCVFVCVCVCVFVCVCVCVFVLRVWRTSVWWYAEYRSLL